MPDLVKENVQVPDLVKVDLEVTDLVKENVQVVKEGLTVKIRRIHDRKE